MADPACLLLAVTVGKGEDGRGNGLLEGGLDPGPDIRHVEVLEGREGVEARVEVVGGLAARVGLDAHEDREPIDGARDGLGRRGGDVRFLRVNECLEDLGGLCLGARVRQGVEERDEAARDDGGLGRGLVVQVVRRRLGEPVGERGHVERGDREDVDEALVAPRPHPRAHELLERGEAVVRGEPELRVGDVELVLVRALAAEVEGRQVAVEVGQGLGEVERGLLRALTIGVRGRAEPVDLEELVDAAGRGGRERLDRAGEALEPLEVERVGGRGGRELARRVREVAGLREELGVLPQGLDALLPCARSAGVSDWRERRTKGVA